MKRSNNTDLFVCAVACYKNQLLLKQVVYICFAFSKHSLITKKHDSQMNTKCNLVVIINIMSSYLPCRFDHRLETSSHPIADC